MVKNSKLIQNFQYRSRNKYYCSCCLFFKKYCYTNENSFQKGWCVYTCWSLLWKEKRFTYFCMKEAFGMIVLGLLVKCQTTVKVLVFNAQKVQKTLSIKIIELICFFFNIFFLKCTVYLNFFRIFWGIANLRISIEILTNTQSWQNWLNCQICILTYLQFSYLYTQ